MARSSKELESMNYEEFNLIEAKKALDRTRSVYDAAKQLKIPEEAFLTLFSQYSGITAHHYLRGGVPLYSGINGNKDSRKQKRISLRASMEKGQVRKSRGVRNSWGP